MSCIAAESIVPKPIHKQQVKEQDQANTNDFTVGTRIRHTKFGEGVIIEKQFTKDGILTVTTRFITGGVKSFSLLIALKNHMIEKL